jgi:hypothetical protein
MDRNSTNWEYGKMKKGWKPFSPKNKLVQDPEGNEENRCPDPDSNKTKINYAKNPRKTQEHLKEEILQVITENFMDILLEMVN